MIREVNSTEIDSNFMARETQDSPPLQRHGYKQSSKLSQLQQSIEFTYCDFPCHFKVHSDKPVLTFHRWKSKTDKRLTITANFQERNLGTTLSGKKFQPVGRIVKSWTSHVHVISQSNSRI